MSGEMSRNTFPPPEPETGAARNASRGEAGSSKRPPGRPVVAPEDRLEVGTVRLTREQWSKLAKLGGAEWLRKAIQRAKLPAA
jgi:hypothetical protein